MSKVLVADDSATIRGVAESLLRHNGYEVISASDGSKALAMAKSQSPDLVFLDHLMPGKDGLTVCRELKADPRLRNIPVIMLLGAPEAREAEKFLAAGASDYLLKPFVPKDFVEKAQKFLSPFSGAPLVTQDTSKLPASTLLEEALASATPEENLNLETLLGAASSRQLEEETGKVPTLPPQQSAPTGEREPWGDTNPDEMTIKLYSQEEKTRPKPHERPKKTGPLKSATGPAKSDSGKLKLEKEKDDLVLAANPFGLGEEDLDLPVGMGSPKGEPHDYDWFLKEMQKESQAPSIPSSKPAATSAPSAPPRKKEETSEELKLKVEEMGTSRLGYERFINEFKKEMMKLETPEEKPVYGETKIDPQAVVEAQQKVKTDKVRIASGPAPSVPPPASSDPPVIPEELLNQVVSAVAHELAQRFSSQLDKEEILRLLQEKLGKLGK